MKNQIKFKSLLLSAAMVAFLFSACDKSAEKVKTLEAAMQMAKMANDSLQLLLTNETKGEEELKCLKPINEKDAFEMINNYDPKKDGAVRSVVSYYLHTKYLLKKYKSHMYTTFCKMKDGRINVVISVLENNSKVWEYYTVDPDCGSKSGENNDGNGNNPSSGDTSCCAPVCPTACYCPPNPPSVCHH